MTAIAYAPVGASVVVLQIRDFAGRPVAEQATLKAELEALAAAALEPLVAGSRVVLDAGQALAIVVLESPEAALALAERAQAAGAKLPLGLALNYGPVKPAPDAQRGPGLVGDGFAAALTLAGAAPPGKIVASRAFREALAAQAPDSAASLTDQGAVTDSNVRTHELYALDRSAAVSRRRWLYVAGAATAMLIVGAALALRGVLKPPPPPVYPAVIGLQIAPKGDIFIDGVLQGSSPPLTSLEVSPGPHVIEVRNPPYPPLRLEANAGSGEHLTITHTFATAPAPAPASRPKTHKAPRKQDEGFLQGLRRKLGI